MGLQFPNGQGFYTNGSGTLAVGFGSTITNAYRNGITFSQNRALQWTDTTDGDPMTNTVDTILSKKSAGILRFGTTSANSAGSLEATNGTFLGTLAVTGASTLTGGIVGTTAAGNATAGNLGEYVPSLIASGSAVSLTTATAANVTSISLTAGDWDVGGNVNFTETTSTVTARSAGISTTTATLPTDGSEAYCGVQSTLTSEINTISLPRKRINVSSTTTVYLVGSATFSAGTCAGFGTITARRVR
jgi:hypothetical protein